MRKPAVTLLLLGLATNLSACASPAPTQAALGAAAPAISQQTSPPQTTPPDPAQMAVSASTPMVATATTQMDAAASTPMVAAAPGVTGVASWYLASRRLHRTYTGEIFSNSKYTAASTVLPMGTMVRVERVSDGRSVVVRVNDRMPRNHRVIDLSEIAARELGLVGCGVATVTVTPVEVASEP